MARRASGKRRRYRYPRTLRGAVLLILGRLLMALVVIIGVFVLSSMEWSFAHGGRTDKTGCHTVSKTGERHCHGDKAKQSAPAQEAPRVRPPAPSGASWRGLVVAPENRCSPYRRKDYSYSQSVEQRIIDRQGGIFSPYDGSTFASKRETDIEHIVATSEAHDSGACAWPARDRKRFAGDLDNLTLASPQLNRHQKKGKDFAEWQPPQSQCWMAQTVVHVKRKHGLTVDAAEQQALERVLSTC